MKIEVKLKDPKFCDGCPCWNHDPEYGDSCNLDYWGHEYSEDNVLNQCQNCKKYFKSGSANTECLSKPKGWKGNHYIDYNVERIPRPQECIDEHGE